LTCPPEKWCKSKGKTWTIEEREAGKMQKKNYTPEKIIGVLRESKLAEK